MEDDYGDIDMEELESRLYSQVYHATSQDYEEQIPSLPLHNNNQSRTRYYQLFDKQSNGLNNQGTRVKLNANTVSNDSADSSFQIVLNPINNFVVVPASDAKENKKHRKQNSRRIKRSKEKFFRKKAEMQLMEKGKKGLSMMQKKVNQFDKLISLFKGKKAKNKKHEVVRIDPSPEVVNLLDTDDDDCVMIPEKRPLVCVSDSESESEAIETEKCAADQKKKTSQSSDIIDDDIIFVEPPPQEVICVDIDDDYDRCKLTSVEDNTNNIVSAESLSLVPSHDNSIADHAQKNAPANESTTSNDFLEPSTETTDNNFNFSLHGSDFNEEFIRPANPCESYESASSCSTSDFNPPLKPVVFNTIDFPKEDLFSEGNLENFSQLITPKRNSSAKKLEKNISVGVEHKKDKTTSMDVSSDSSSESDYVDSTPVKHRTKKKLPDLSNMSCEDEVSKSRKRKSTESESLDSEEVPKRQRSLKRKSEVDETPKKKSKKKRRSVCVAEDIQPASNREDVTTVSNHETISTHSPKPPKVNDKSKGIAEGEFDTHQVIIADSSISAPVTKAKNKTKDNMVEAHDPAQTSTSDKDTTSAPPSKSTKIRVRDETKGKVEAVSHSRAALGEEKSSHSVLNKNSNIIEKDVAALHSTVHEPQADLQINITSEEIKSDGNGECCKRLSFADMWTPNKTLFYSKPIDVTNCDVSSIQNTMSDDPTKWKICNNDRFPTPIKNRGPRCMRCRNFGHMAYMCPNRSKVCSTCGEPGHLHSSCRISLCKQCGEHLKHRGQWCNKCFVFRNRFCTLCRVRGHSNMVCPDLWRRYHLTTKKGPLKKPKNKTLKPVNQLWCSSCAKSGHLEASCSQSCDPQFLMTIRCYDDVYDTQENPVPESSSSTTVQAEYHQERDTTISSLLPQNSSASSELVSKQPSVPGNNIFIPLSSNNQQHYSADGTGRLPLINNSVPSMLANNQVFNLGNFSNIGSMLLTNLQTIQNALLQVPQRLSNIPLLNYQNNVVNRGQGTQQVFRNLPVPNHAASPSNLVENSINVVHDDEVYRIINLEPMHIVKAFLRSELMRLQRFRCDPVFLGRKITELETSAGRYPYSQNDLREYYMQFNMLAFGIHGFLEGDAHLKTLRKFQTWPQSYRITFNKRKQVWDSYNYIFGKAKHTQDHFKLLQLIINKK